MNIPNNKREKGEQVVYLIALELRLRLAGWPGSPCPDDSFLKCRSRP